MRPYCNAAVCLFRALKYHLLWCSYIHTFQSGFDEGLPDVNLQFMQSDGGLTPVDLFSGHKAILSGPAGGCVFYQHCNAAACEVHIRGKDAADEKIASVSFSCRARVPVCNLRGS